MPGYAGADLPWMQKCCYCGKPIDHRAIEETKEGLWVGGPFLTWGDHTGRYAAHIECADAKDATIVGTTRSQIVGGVQTKLFEGEDK